MSAIDIMGLKSAVTVNRSSGRGGGNEAIEEVLRQIMSLHSPEDGERLATLADELYGEAVKGLPHGTVSHSQAYQAGKIMCLAMLVRFHQQR